MSSSHKHGSLSGVSRDRKLDTWKFHSADRAMALDLSFDVYITPRLSFRVETKGIPPERFETLEGRDLAILHSQAQDAARAEFTLRNNLTWSDWLEIKVQSLPSYNSQGIVSGAQACVTYKVIPRAQTPDGQAYTVTDNKTNPTLIKFPTDTSVATPDQRDTGMRAISESDLLEVKSSTRPNSADRISALISARDSRNPDTQYSYLPDSPENRAGLDAIIQVINQANHRLQEFLSPDQLVKTIERARTAASNLLSGPTHPPSSPRPPRKP